jgi:hypothetical protein
MQEQDLARRVGLGHGPDVAGLVVDDREDPVARVTERGERRHLRLRDALFPCARVHVQQLRGELDPVLPAQRVERLQRLRSEVLGAPGVECDRRVGLDLEPPDHVEHALVRAMGGEDGLGLPALLEVPAVRPLGDGGRERHVPQQLVDLVLVDGDVVGGETVEPVGAVGPVERQQHVTDHVPHVQDRAVDVEDDQQLILGILAAEAAVVGGEPPHPVAH